MHNVHTTYTSRIIYKILKYLCNMYSREYNITYIILLLEYNIA